MTLFTAGYGTYAEFAFNPVYLAPIFLGLFLLVFAGYLTGLDRLPRVAAALGLLAWLCLSSTIMPHAMYVGTSTGLPMWDEPMARVDQALGIDIASLVRATGSQQWFADFCLETYKRFHLEGMVAYVLLIAWGRLARLRDVITMMTVGMTVTLVVSWLMPTIGMAAYYGITQQDLGHLASSGAAWWHVDHYMALHAGTMKEFPTASGWYGIVSFPSFHVIHALVAVYAVAHNRALAFVFAVWSGMIIFTSVPVGGHHFIDLVAGYAIFAALVWWHEPRPVIAAEESPDFRWSRVSQTSAA